MNTITQTKESSPKVCLGHLESFEIDVLKIGKENIFLSEEQAKIMKQFIEKRVEEDEMLLDELTESWVWSLSVCYQSGGKINDFENVMRQAMEAAFYRRQTDSDE